MKNNYQTLRLILGDQLNAAHSWFRQTDDKCLYLIAELNQEVCYTCHHIQKICAFFGAMQNFATALRKAGHHVLYMSLDDTANYKDVIELILHLSEKYKISEFQFQRPDEYRLRQQLGSSTLKQGITITEYDTEHFLIPFEELQGLFPEGKPGRMETFYRKMRKRFNILMESDQPAGNKWNFDAENRQKLKTSDLKIIPEPLLFANSVKDILKRLKKHQVQSIGVPAEMLVWPVSRDQATKLLNAFCQKALPYFGKYQDAMTDNSPYQWSLYHSRLSFALNSKMIHPLKVIERVVAHWQQHQDTITIAQVEGFIRQILGWREYIRGVYWTNMPSYQSLNHLKAKRKLPDFFWTGNTRMNCLHQAISQSLEYAYAHHIQRLMVTGNYCMLAGIDPEQVDQWYLGIYIDAIEWVELPNTRGMSQFGDGGMVASKPYAASGNYIKKMSDYCSSCYYKVNEKTSKRSCPLNSLYWHFMDRHRDKFGKNPRTALVYKNWDKQSDDEKQLILKRGDWCLRHQNKL